MHPGGNEIAIPSLAMALLLIAQKYKESMIADLIQLVALNLETIAEDKMLDQVAAAAAELTIEAIIERLDKVCYQIQNHILESKDYLDKTIKDNTTKLIKAATIATFTIHQVASDTLHHNSKSIYKTVQKMMEQTPNNLDNESQLIKLLQNRENAGK